jgi:hypothetical protein
MVSLRSCPKSNPKSNGGGVSIESKDHVVALQHDSGVLRSPESDLCSGLLNDCWEIHSLLHLTSMSGGLWGHETHPVHWSCVGDGEQGTKDDDSSWHTAGGGR